MSVSQEDYDDFVHYSSARSAELRTAHRELEKNFSELKKSVLEMEKRQHIIAAGLLTLVDKLEPGLIEMEELADRKNDNLFTVDAGFGSIETEED
jgi:hypothetical protein